MDKLSGAIISPEAPVNLNSVCRKGLEFAGVETSNTRLVKLMEPFVLDPGCREVFPELKPNEIPLDVEASTLQFENKAQPPVPVLTDAMIPYILSRPGISVVAGDVSGLYSFNGVGEIHGDEAVRKMLVELCAKFGVNPDEVILRFKGDLFFIVRKCASPEEKSAFQSEVSNFLAGFDSAEQLSPEDRNKLACYSVGPDGKIILKPVLMHLDKEVHLEDFEPENKGDLDTRIQQLVKHHSELKEVITEVQKQPSDQQSTLIGIIEGRLMDARLQKVAEARSSANCDIRVYNDWKDLQEHILENGSKILKVDVASALKSVNGEFFFAEKAGDVFLEVLFDEFIKTIQTDIPDVKNITCSRRWGDFFFVDNEENCTKIAEAFCNFFKDHQYAIIKNNNITDSESIEKWRAGDKKSTTFNVEFTNTPPELPANNKDTFVLPMMPIVAIDTTIELQKTETLPDEHIPFRERVAENNLAMFTARGQVLEDVIKDARPDMIARQLQDATAEKIEFILFRALNPNDVKRGRPRLLKTFSANPFEVHDLQDIMNDIEDWSNNHGNDSRDTVNRVRAIKEMVTSDPAYLGFINKFVRQFKEFDSRTKADKSRNFPTGVKIYTP